MERTYGQFCGVVRALETVGERWGMLLVRDLLNGPKRFTDLLNGLPGIPSNVLTSRLKELEREGVVKRRALPLPERAVVYELTEYGNELEPIVFALGRWGAKSLRDPRPGEVLTPDSLVVALRATFVPHVARGKRVSFELRAGPFSIHAIVNDGELEAGSGPLPAPDAIIHASPAIRALMARELTPEAALESGSLAVEGDPKLLSVFADLFRIDPKPGR